MIKKYKCPICNKEIEIEEDGKWIYHRPWTFHIALDHADVFKTNIIPREDIPLWLRFLWLDKKTQEELVPELNLKNNPPEINGNKRPSLQFGIGEAVERVRRETR